MQQLLQVEPIPFDVGQPKTQTSHYVATTKHFTGYRPASWIGIRVIPVKHEEIVATAPPYGKREPRIVGKQTHRGFRTAKLNRITLLLLLLLLRWILPRIRYRWFPQSVVGNWLLIRSVAFNDQFPRTETFEPSKLNHIFVSIRPRLTRHLLL